MCKSIVVLYDSLDSPLPLAYASFFFYLDVYFDMVYLYMLLPPIFPYISGPFGIVCIVLDMSSYMLFIFICRRNLWSISGCYSYFNLIDNFQAENNFFLFYHRVQLKWFILEEVMRLQHWNAIIMSYWMGSLWRSRLLVPMRECQLRLVSMWQECKEGRRGQS